MPRVLLVTDLTYQARGRRYCDEDIALAAALRAHVTLSLCHPLDAEALMHDVDVVVVRNSGPVIGYQAAYDSFRASARDNGTKVLNELSGKADQLGKGYLLDLWAAGYPVIPTVETHEDLERLPVVSRYVVKPKLGADSVGLRFVERPELDGLDLTGLLVQPMVPLTYEVSFYFVDHTFQYALHAPDPTARWALEPYQPTPDDLAFARTFIDWNDIEHGIQRVDACRTPEGDLLLVELEDWNPYLSLDLVTPDQRATLVTDLAASIRALADQPTAG